MDPDLLLVIGIVLGVLAVPAILSAFTDGRPPRAAAILIMVSAGLIGLAVVNRPMAYTLDEVPDVVVRVIGRYLN
ncbi:MAG: hypothetical protein KJZ85_09755 [Rhodobacteraceae bacterium]|jgi:hypothetical protein|nr:hypothetical protein [Paracoccaceae bacterium]